MKAWGSWRRTYKLYINLKLDQFIRQHEKEQLEKLRAQVCILEPDGIGAYTHIVASSDQRQAVGNCQSPRLYAIILVGS